MVAPNTSFDYLATGMEPSWVSYPLACW